MRVYRGGCTRRSRVDPGEKIRGAAVERNRALETGRLTEAAREIEKRKRKRRRGASRDRACFTMGVPYGGRVADCSLGEVCRPPLSFVSGPPIQHTACDSQWPAKCASRRSPPLSLVPHRSFSLSSFCQAGQSRRRLGDRRDFLKEKRTKRKGRREKETKKRKGRQREREREGGSDTVR